jgi:hypothetical protein
LNIQCFVYLARLAYALWYFCKSDLNCAYRLFLTSICEHFSQSAFDCFLIRCRGRVIVPTWLVI